VLRPFQALFKPADHPELLIGLGSPDDAAVYRLDSERALIVTTDFFTPIVDDPYDYGAIAAANSLSDVYAMGGRPILALNIVAFPTSLVEDVLGEVMRGLADTVFQAGAVVAGGHSIQDNEPKVGLCAVGLAHPERLLTKGGLRAGDLLVLTKPLGTGIITTAAKKDRVDAAHLAQAVTWMKKLNRSGAEVAQALGLRAATDITGFGLLGHAWEMAEASGVGLRLSLRDIPLLDGVRDYAQQKLVPGGSAANRDNYSPHVHFDAAITEVDRIILFDAQTSGGLLLGVPAASRRDFQTRMASQNEPFWFIGEAVKGGDIQVS
jgi:selenide,water dikinase